MASSISAFSFIVRLFEKISSDVTITNFKTKIPYNIDQLDINNAFFLLTFGDKQMFLDFREKFYPRARKVSYLQPFISESLRIDLQYYIDDNTVEKEIRSYFRLL